ncbi:uroporphyrinogen-III synthase [Sphingosinicella sp.]|uniref:uroporphyrinogen-III synthase n=1 Tax=Sphingosinicella sp. TaxID=1917971 RepID=UPI004037F98E
MTLPLLILRPQPGANETAARAQTLGLYPIVAPLFTVHALAWEPPAAGEFDAIMLTSANAARRAGAGLSAFLGLPCYAVGEATAAAASDAGFTDVRIGPEDGVALLMTMEAGGIARALHPCGADHVTLEPAEMRIVRIPVYEAQAVEALPPHAEAALAGDAVALLHSARAARLFGALVGDRSRIAVAAISPRTARAAGSGWRQVAVAAEPRDHALLALAAKLCQTVAQED